MATIDDKVVAMSFESSKFESGVSAVISALDKLKKALVFPDAGKGLEQVGKAAQGIDLSHIAAGVDTIKNKLGAFQVAALAIFANVAQKAVAAGAQFVKSFTVGPLIAGLHEYSTNLNAIQTILANTQASGAGLKDVNAALQELNTYSDKTIYNFSQMAKNIGTFTAAGVGLKPATAAIKGIANLAALSGSNADQASNAMYQLSQAISAGRVSLQDWNSVVNAGMGGTVFQRALAQTAVAMGKLKDSSLKLVGPMKNVSIDGESFRQSIQAGPGKTSWLTSDVLTKTLSQFTGDLTKAQLKAQGFNDAQIKSIQATAKTAMHAATEVKTLGQVFDVAKETAGSGWAQTFQIIFGNFKEAKTTFTALSNAINGFINTNSKARNKVLADWKALGGRTILIDNIKQAFHNLGMILKPIKEAFRDIFPRTTGRDLLKLTVLFARFAQALQPSPKTIENLRRTFRGLFAILDIGKQVVSGIFTVLGKLFHATGAGQGGFLSLTARIGDFLVALDKALKRGDSLSKFFVKMGDILVVPIKLIKELAKVIGNLFAGFSPGGFSVQLDAATKTSSAFKKVLEAVVELLKNLGKAIGQAAQNMNFDAILAVIRTGLLGAIVVMLKQFFGKGSLLEQISKGFGKGIIGNISDSFGALTGSLKAMQNNIKANTLKQIAIAVGILALSIVALSLVDPKKLNSAIGAITVAFGELLGAMAILDKIGKSGGFIKMPFIAGSMILLAGAIDVLAIAVIALSRLSWDKLLKGLAGVGGLLVGISLAVGPLSAGSAGLVKAGIGLIAIAVAMNIMAKAVAAFGALNLKELAKGLGGIAIGLNLMIDAIAAIPAKSVFAKGVSLVAVAGALKIMASAVAQLGQLGLATLAKGIGAIAGALFILSEALYDMPPNLPATAAGLVLVSVALNGIARAVKTMGGMSITQIAKGIGTLAIALGVLSIALEAMSLTGTLQGAAALTLAAAGIALLAPALERMGKQSWMNIIKGMVSLAGAMAILGGAALLLAPVAPAMLAVGAGLLLIGGGLALAGAGIALVGVGLSAIAVAGPTAIGILLQALVQFTDALGKMGVNLVNGLLQIAEQLAKTAPKFVDALVKIIDSLLTAIIKSTPKLIKAIETLIDAMLKVLNDKQDKIIAAGFSLLLALLKGIRDNIGQIVDMAASIIVKFIKGLGDNVKKIIDAGAYFIAKFIEGIGSAEITIANTATDVMIKFVAALGKNSIKLINAGARALLKFLNGLADAIDKYEPQIIKAGFRIGVAIVTGIPKGMASVAEEVYKKAKEIAKKAKHYLTHPWEAFSPSRVMVELGQNIVLGLSKGLDDNAKHVYSSAEAMANYMIKTFNDVFQTHSPSKVMEQMGRFLTQGLANGIKAGSKQDLGKVFKELNQKLVDEIKNSRKTVESETNKLVDLYLAKKQDPAKIKKTEDIIDKNRAQVDSLTAAHKALNDELAGEKWILLDLANQYDILGNKLEKAKNVLAEAKKTRDDAAKQFSEQFATLPDIVTTDQAGRPVDQVATYEESLMKQAAAVTAFKKTLDQLRKLGLDDTTYKKLLSDGTADQQFADQLLAGGKDAVTHLNQLDKNLSTAASGLGKDAAAQLYQAGVDAAQGLVDGLKAKRADLKAIMTIIADDIVTTMKDKLKSKSPSEIFAEIGRDTMLGMANGISGSSKLVTDSVESAATDAISVMRNSMSKVNAAVAESIDSNPVITPILDLTQVKSQAKDLASTPITASVSYGQATAISSTQADGQVEDATVAPGGTVVKFEQNNYSPKALDSVDIYRKTRGQLAQLQSMARGPVVA